MEVYGAIQVLPGSSCSTQLWSFGQSLNPGEYCIGFTLLLQIVCIYPALAHVISPFYPHFLLSFLSCLLSVVLFRPNEDASVSVRCVKTCQSNNISCIHDPVHLITHTGLSLPTFRDFSEPEGKTRWRYSKFVGTAPRCL